MGSLKDLFVKVNRDPAFRAKFLADPAGTLTAAGINVSGAAAQDLAWLRPVVMKHLPDLSKVPMGYEAMLTEVDTGNAAGHTDDPEMLIL